MEHYIDPHKKILHTLIIFQFIVLFVVITFAMNQLYQKSVSFYSKEQLYIPRHAVADPQVIGGSSFNKTVGNYGIIAGGIDNIMIGGAATICTDGTELGNCISEPTKSGSCDCWVYKNNNPAARGTSRGVVTSEKR